MDKIEELNTTITAISDVNNMLLEDNKNYAQKVLQCESKMNELILENNKLKSENTTYKEFIEKLVNLKDLILSKLSTLDSLENIGEITDILKQV